MRNYEIIDSKTLPSKPGCVEARVILCKLPGNKITPYVTWQQNVEDGSRYWGRYHETLREAVGEFHQRCNETGAV